MAGFITARPWQRRPRQRRTQVAAMACSLSSLPDDLILQVVILCDMRSVRQLMLTSARLYNHLQSVPRIERLFGPFAIRESDPQKIADLIDDLAKTMPSSTTMQLIRSRLTHESAVRVLDRLANEVYYPQAICHLVSVLKLEMFADLAPGVFLHFYMNCLSPSPIYFENLQQTLLIVRKSALPIPTSDFPEKFQNIIRRFLSSYRDCMKNWIPEREFPEPLRRLFSNSTLQITGGLRQLSNYISFYILQYVSEIGPVLLKDPSLLVSLLRIGIRFNLEDYFRRLSPSPTEVPTISPFLSPFPGGCTTTIKVLFDCNRPDMVQVLFVFRGLLERISKDSYGLFVSLFEALRQKSYHVYREIRQSVGLNQVINQRRFPGGISLLHVAIQQNVPADILTDLLECSELNLRCKDWYGKTAFDYADKSKRIKVKNNFNPIVAQNADIFFW